LKARIAHEHAQALLDLGGGVGEPLDVDDARARIRTDALAPPGSLRY
jgi:hypothetical protein